jgi:hypothetical protein
MSKVEMVNSSTRMPPFNPYTPYTVAKIQATREFKPYKGAYIPPYTVGYYIRLPYMNFFSYTPYGWGVYGTIYGQNPRHTGIAPKCIRYIRFERVVAAKK